MRLYLVQHGAALPKQQDPARALSSQGVQEVTRMAAMLAAAGSARMYTKPPGLASWVALAGAGIAAGTTGYQAAHFQRG